LILTVFPVESFSANARVIAVEIVAIDCIRGYTRAVATCQALVHVVGTPGALPPCSAVAGDGASSSDAIGGWGARVGSRLCTLKAISGIDCGSRC